ncbi:hypothetical protein F383_36781 [Gossypium arboreum]|uniref:Uncharacterized protein n=1 Tax=Gossypium arboreum TaxID=29729 RepID=A0A0B0MAW7_GOSAR|nr:hypothetical protein F383_36781 [Gossypium arboreum]
MYRVLMFWTLLHVKRKVLN